MENNSEIKTYNYLHTPTTNNNQDFPVSNGTSPYSHSAKHDDMNGASSYQNR